MRSWWHRVVFLVVPAVVCLAGRCLHGRFDAHVVVATLAGLLFAVCLLWATSLYGPEIRTASVTLGRKRIVPLIFALLTLVTTSVSLLRPDDLNSRPSWLSSPGVLFVLVLGAVTVAGFLFTVSKLDEIHGRILDYSHLIERCEHLVNQEVERVRAGKPGRVIIFANAAAFGNVSAPREFTMYVEGLNILLPHERVSVELACLSWVPDGADGSAHDRFYHAHFGRADDLAARIKQSKGIIDKVGGANDLGIPGKSLYRLVGIREVPFHLFMTTSRAIVFNTLSYPTGQNPGVVAEKPAGGRTADRVEIIAYETGDGAILSALDRGVHARLNDSAISQRETRYPSQLAGGAPRAQQAGGEEGAHEMGCELL